MSNQLRRINPEIYLQIKEDYEKMKQLMSNRCSDWKGIRQSKKDKFTYTRPAFVRDVDKILNHPYYNRYTDKTQVFSFFKNDDISHRSLHVQLVSRIARTVGASLRLNLDLIEAIALGHDLGHTPFGHAGEEKLNELYNGNTSRYFAHNVHSVRALHKIIPVNLTLPTLSGIICHNGEKGEQELHPRQVADFAEFEDQMESCYIEGSNFMAHMVANTLEGCLVRLCDMIAYVGKDRQDAYKASLITKKDIELTDSLIGHTNVQIVHNLTCDIIECSYNKPYIAMSPEYFNALIKLKEQNNEIIYQSKKVREQYTHYIHPMMEQLYNQLLSDLQTGKAGSPIYEHHINFVKKFSGTESYEQTEPNQIVVDYIASMTDDYFLDLHDYLFPGSPYKIDFFSYFQKL